MILEIPKCPNCNAPNWEESEPYCEDCGNHLGFRCKECLYEVDHVYDKLYDAIRDALERR